jgi:hypothetical protein
MVTPFCEPIITSAHASPLRFGFALIKIKIALADKTVQRHVNPADGNVISRDII